MESFFESLTEDLKSKENLTIYFGDVSYSLKERKSNHYIKINPNIMSKSSRTFKKRNWQTCC